MINCKYLCQNDSVVGFKFIQVNIYKGKYLDALLEFLKSENPDFISMQEVTAGAANFYEDKGANLFDLLAKKLDYRGVFHFDTKFSDAANSFFGNAVFSKWPIVKSQVLELKIFRPVTLFEFNNNVNKVWENIARHMLDATVALGDLKIHAISIHGRRTAPPVDDAENIRQAKLVATYLRSLKDKPFVVGGDFNMPSNSQVIKILSKVATNLMENSGIGQTLNPKVHELGDKGYLVDYIFTSKHFKLLSLKVPQVTVSDHLPVVAQLEI